MTTAYGAALDFFTLIAIRQVVSVWRWISQEPFMPIKVPDNLPALETLNAEQVDVMPQELAARQDIRPLRLLLLNLMPKKRDTEIQFARLFGNTPLQVEMILMLSLIHI